MNFYVNDAELRLKSALGSYEKYADAVAIKVSLSKLPIRNDRNDSRAIAINILRDQFKSASGDLYVLSNSDVIVVYRGRTDNMIQECMYHIQYLFAEEGPQLSMTEALLPQYVQIYYPDQWEDFINWCQAMLNRRNSKTSSMSHNHSMLLSISSMIEDVLLSINWAKLIDVSEINKWSQNRNPTLVLKDLHIDISSLAYVAGKHFDIINNQYLGSYVKEFLDLKLLIRLVELLANQSQDNAYLLNLNMSTISSSEFWELSTSLSENIKRRIIVAISISDVFSDFAFFLQMRNKLAEQGFKLCLDNLDYLSFMQIDRTSLGFDLVRINHSTVYDIIRLSEMEDQVRNKIQICGSSRVILKVQNDKDATIGQKFGVILFQMFKHIEEEI
jgi:hypothetical protein